MNETYQFGLLLLVFGGFLALNSTETFADVGIAGLFVGFLFGTIGLLQSSLSE